MLKDLVDGELEKDFIKASNASVWGCFLLNKGAFKHLVLKCTINRDVCKRTCLIGAFIQNLVHF